MPLPWAQVIQATITKHRQNSETFRAFSSACSLDEDPSPAPDLPVSQQPAAGRMGGTLDCPVGQRAEGTHADVKTVTVPHFLSIRVGTAGHSEAELSVKEVLFCWLFCLLFDI